MIIYVNGERLDTYAGGVSVQKKNNLWELSTVSMQRTQSIKIPATPHNMAVFGFPNDPATTALSDVDFLACTVDMDGYMQAARLYTTGFDGTDVSAVLVFGEESEGSDMLNQTLQEILQDVESKGIRYIDSLEFFDVKTYRGTAPAITFDLITQLLSEKWTYNDLLDIEAITAPHPTSLDPLYTPDASRFLVVLDKLDADYYMINRKITGGGDDIEEGNMFTENTKRMNIAPATDMISTVVTTNGLGVCFSVDGTTNKRETWYAKMRFVRLSHDMRITFPKTPEMDKILIATMEDMSDTMWTYLGGRSINTQGVLIGQSLIGRSIDIPAGTPWMLLTADDYLYNSKQATKTVTGWFWLGYTLDLLIPAGIMTERANVLTKDMIPPIRLYDWFKFQAALRGEFLVFDGSKYVLAGFDDLTGDGDDAGAVQTKQTITPKVGNFAQHNKIEFSGGKPYRGNIDYAINNKHLDEDKTILSVKLDAGYPANGTETPRTIAGYPVFTTEEDTEESTPKKWSFGATFWNGGSLIIRSLTQYPFGTAGNFPTNSKQIQVTARMPYYQFAQLKYNTVLRVGLCRYSWVSATWESGWCKLTLQRI